MRVLVVNAGSSSIKLRVIDAEDQVTAKADLDAPGADLADRLDEFVSEAGPLDATGHRIVHGGPRFRDAVVLDDKTRAELDEVSELAPLHNPPALAAIDALHRLLPRLSTVVSFDTAFHATLPVEAVTYALPAEWVARWGLRRYGFHGLSCAWATARTAQLLDWPTNHGRIVVCHLGSGASVTAVVDGRSVDTTMGFTPLEGLIMATRPGDVDPGIITWLLARGIVAADLDDALEHRSGLAALSGEASGDMRTVLKRRSSGDEAAGLAIGAYVHRLRAKIAAMTSAMGGLDALVFTGGIGENSPVIRAECCAGLGWLGVETDEHANRTVASDDLNVSAAAARLPTMVVHAREELVIAADCRRLLSRYGATSA